MEHIDFQGINLAELLQRVPESIQNGLPFGVVKLSLTGTILEYNMAESEITGIDATWAIGKNFFDEVALCTKTAAFYGRFLEGVRRGFLNVVFDFAFDHREVATQVKVHMFTMPNRKGEKIVMLLVKRAGGPLAPHAVDAQPKMAASDAATATAKTHPEPSWAPTQPIAPPTMNDIVSAVLAAMNQGVNVVDAAPAAPVRLPVPVTPAAPVKSASRHQDIMKF